MRASMCRPPRAASLASHVQVIEIKNKYSEPPERIKPFHKLLDIYLKFLMLQRGKGLFYMGKPSLSTAEDGALFAVSELEATGLCSMPLPHDESRSYAESGLAMLSRSGAALFFHRTEW